MHILLQGLRFTEEVDFARVIALISSFSFFYGFLDKFLSIPKPALEIVVPIPSEGLFVNYPNCFLTLFSYVYILTTKRARHCLILLTNFGLQDL